MFDRLKVDLDLAPILRVADHGREISLHDDTSDVAISEVLCQEENGFPVPLAYTSKKPVPSQKRYVTIEKEALAVLHCLNKLGRYVDNGKKVYVYSDQDPLKFIDSMKGKTAKLAQWVLILQNKETAIGDERNCESLVANTLSRPG